jgi:hypothetical protein
MNNPIPQTQMWITPDNLEDLYATLEQYSGSERVVAVHILMLTLNLCHKLVDEVNHAV